MLCTAVEVCKTIESSFWKHEKFDPRIKVGDASSPNLKSHKVEPGQAARYELMRVQVLHLASTLGVDHPSLRDAIEQLANSRYVYVRWLAAEARLALAYTNGAGAGFIRALVAFKKSYADLSGKRGELSLLSPDQGPASNLPIAPHEWFGLLTAGSVCADNNLQSSLNSWLNESIQEVGSGTTLTDVVRLMIEGASMETDQREITSRSASNPAALRCGAAASLLCSGLDASKTLQLQAFLTSALVSDKSFARQELFNLHVARRFAKPWRAHVENRFQFSCPRTTVPQLLNTVDGVTKGTYTLKDLLQSAGSALGQPLGDFMERVH